MLRLLPQVKNPEDAQMQKCQQCQALLPRLFSSKGTDLQRLNLVSHLHHLKICLCPHKLPCQHRVSTYLMLPQHSSGSHSAKAQTLTVSTRPWVTHDTCPPFCYRPLPGFSSCLSLCSTSTSHSGPDTAASFLLLKHDIKSSLGNVCLAVSLPVILLRKIAQLTSFPRQVSALTSLYGEAFPDPTPHSQHSLIPKSCVVFSP